MKPLRRFAVVAGHIINTVDGGGLEFFGPYSVTEADDVRDAMRQAMLHQDIEDWVCFSIELLHYVHKHG